MLLLLGWHWPMHLRGVGRALLSGGRARTSHHNVTSLVTKLVTNNWGSNALLA
jgi:hypothetical protein